MKIIYNENPLYTAVELDEHEKKELWYKIKIEEMEQLLFEAHFYLQEDKTYHDMARVKTAVDPDYYMAEHDGEKSQLEERCDQMLKFYLEELQERHIGDCTCFATSCGKCHAESLLGINTMPGLGKHSAHQIEGAFGKNNENTIVEALNYLKNYDPKPTPEWLKIGGFEKYLPRWKNEAQAAYDWLLDYRNRHFSNGE